MKELAVSVETARRNVSPLQQIEEIKMELKLGILFLIVPLSSFLRIYTQLTSLPLPTQ